MSDRRIKENIVEVGVDQRTALPLYEFNYKEGFGDPNIRYVGVMADEVELSYPDAVAVMDNGFMAVNYGLRRASSLRRSAMARKSPWQEFAENFQGVYGTFQKIGQDVETGRIMDDEKFTAEGKAGAGLSGGALEKARYKALGDIYTKYGNAKDGLAVRTQLADLESKDRENTINQGIMQELAYLRGQGAVRNLDANSFASEGAGANSYSSANDRAATLNARLLRMQADTQDVLSGTTDGMHFWMEKYFSRLLP